MMSKIFFFLSMRIHNFLQMPSVELCDVIITYMSDVVSANKCYTANPNKRMLLSQMSRPITRDGPTPMEIESTQRRAHHLCLYCEGPRHIVVNCPHKPRRQVYQVSAHENPTSSSIITSNNISKPNSPCHENRFDVLSQLEDVLNE